MYNFYRTFLRNAAHTLAPLVQLLEGHKNIKKSPRSSSKNEKPLQWTNEAESAFLAAKQALAKATLSKHPIPGAR